MGFFSSLGGAIGSIFGPVGTAIGAGLGGAIEGEKARKNQKKAIAEKNRIAKIAAENASRPTTTTQTVDFAGTVKDARLAGFNPLTALRATGGNISSTTTRFVAPLLSSMPSRNFIDVMSDAFDGYQSYERGKINREKEGLEMQYLRNQVFNTNPANIIKPPTINSLDVLKPAGDTITTSKLTSNVGDDWKPNQAIDNPTYEIQQDPVKFEFVQSSEGIVGSTQKSLMNVYVMPWGSKWRLPGEELEFSNMVTGGAILGTAYTLHKMRQMGDYIIYKGNQHRDTRYNTEVNLLKKLQDQMTVREAQGY